MKNGIAWKVGDVVKTRTGEVVTILDEVDGWLKVTKDAVKTYGMDAVDIEHVLISVGAP